MTGTIALHLRRRKPDQNRRRRRLSHDGDRRRDSWFGNPTRESIFLRGKRVAVILAGGHPIYYAEEMRGTSRILFQNNLAA